MNKILLIDDDSEVLNINQKYLTEQGFCVQASDSPKKALSLVKTFAPDCIVSDLMMPETDGFTLCAQLRRITAAPILFLSGLADEESKIKGLTSGAEDYMTKPYSLRELKVRIDLLLRRFQPVAAKSDDAGTQLICGNLRIDRLSHKAFFRDTDLQLANREYEALLFMATHPNRDVTFEELGTALFGTYLESDRRSVMVIVSRLRKKLELDPELSNMLETIWSKGYLFHSV